MSSEQDRYIKRMIEGYLDAALWVGVWDADGDLVHGLTVADIDSATLREAESDVADFARSMWSILSTTEPWATMPEQAGHDFYLTRNGHGAGFWDRGTGAAGDELSDAARPYGSVDWFLQAGEVVGA